MKKNECNNCGYANYPEEPKCIKCGKQVGEPQEMRKLSSYFSTLGKHKHLVKGGLFLTLFLLAIITIPVAIGQPFIWAMTGLLFIYLIYFYVTFSKTWQERGYSRIVLFLWLVFVVAAGVALGMLINGLMG